MSKEQLEEQIAKHPYSAQFHYQLGLWHLERGMYTKAADNLHMAMFTLKLPSQSTSQSEDEDPYQVESAILWLRLGQLHRLQHDLEAACNCFKQATQHQGYEQTALIALGDIRYEQGNTDQEVVTELTSSLLHNKLKDRILFPVLYQLGLYETAIHCFDAQIHTMELHRKWYLECLCRLGLYKQGIDYIAHCDRSEQWLLDVDILRRAIASEQGHPIFPDQNSSLQAIQRYVSLGMLEFAFKVTQQTNHYFQQQLIVSLYREGYVELAKEKMNQVYSIRVIGHESLYNELAFIRGEMYYDAGQYVEAAEEFEQLLPRDPNLASARYAVASCYLQQSLQQISQQMTHYQGEERLQADQYLLEISSSLHIVLNSNWHTVWTPAQRRNLPMNYQQIQNNTLHIHRIQREVVPSVIEG